MPVQVGEVSSTVEVGAAGPAGGAAAPAHEPLEPSWAERDRHRQVARMAIEERDRTEGGGFDA
jgi:hypothetical protein